MLPLTGRGMRIGLFGGSFNPPHEGHRLASLAAMKRLGLHRVWWIVTPGNPLKVAQGLPSLERRIAAAKIVAHHPRIDVTGFEAAIGTRYSVQTVDYLKRRCPGTSFVWIMGADILPELHRWKHWREFVASVPLVIVDRPGSTFNAKRGRAATVMAKGRLRENEAPSLSGKRPPASVFIHGPRSMASSTRLRANGQRVPD
ncbi:nicotinate-nucleotide adenylyltransferase [Lichenihabitans sp. PAMC28606]|nr:nicotinate-nucleotide adenylyltransferase [Lichenihabitans sp. PAMC28606]UDL94000.1 nicotinate-nucleotide adenylyltransferase [Lichenihabitans sp. PAMC28606]